jgi:SAM-dependent methyltransferase
VPRDLINTLSDDEIVAALLTRIEREDTAQAAELRRLGAARLTELLQVDEVPIPAVADREGYFGDDHLAYWLSGQGDYLLLERLAAHEGRPLRADQRFLDFGCASGRVLRHFHLARLGLTLYGVDLALQNVGWAREHLPPSISVVQGTALPSLPFEDNSLDFVYAGSVFTHIADFEEAWLLEIRRVMKPGGLAFLTYHPERVWRDLRDPSHVIRQIVSATPHRLDPLGLEPIPDEIFEESMPAERVVLVNLAYPVNNTNLIHSDRWIDERWGRFFAIEKIVERCHGGQQNGALVTKERA